MAKINFLGEQFDPEPELSETTVNGPPGYDAWFDPKNQPSEYPEAQEHIDTGLPVKRDPFDPAPLLDLFNAFTAKSMSCQINPWG